MAARPVGNALAMAVIASVTLAAIGAGAACMGTRVPLGVILVWGAGAVLARAFPAARIGVTVAAGGVALAIVNPVFALYFGALTAVLVAARRRMLPFAIALTLAAIVWPKLAFGRYYHEPDIWSWLKEPSLAMALFVGAFWFRARANARRAGLPVPDDRMSLALLYLFPSHPIHPMVFGPPTLLRPVLVDMRAIASLLGWFALKVAALVGLRALGPSASLRGLSGADAAALSWLSLWSAVIVSYVETYLALAAATDIPILVARLYGFPLPDPFRAALLAWNPVELWRRWGIYNRRLLLELVFVPLGGSLRHKYRNVVLTFLASALVLHSGWFGSKYWAVGRAGSELVLRVAGAGRVRLPRILGCHRSSPGARRRQPVVRRLVVAEVDRCSRDPSVERTGSCGGAGPRNGPPGPRASDPALRRLLIGGTGDCRLLASGRRENRTRAG